MYFTLLADMDMNSEGLPFKFWNIDFPSYT